MDTDTLDRAIIARIPVLVKARTPDASGRRIVEVEASTEEEDLDGDIILQQALIGSAATFIATGHLDIDHKSELGSRMVPPIRDPASWIVGRPIDVRKAAGGRTFVEGEINRPADGVDDPERSRADELWASMRREPPVVWYASIYGFPIDVDNCTRGECSTGVRAKRLVVKSIDWRSLAFTRTPKNTGLTSPTRIISAKAYMVELAKSELRGPPNSSLLAIPQTMDDVYAAADCPGCRAMEMPSLLGFKSHFAKCMGMSPGLADVLAHATMHRHSMDKAIGRVRNKDGVLK